MYIYVIISGKDDYFKTGPGAGHGRIKACLEQISGDANGIDNTAWGKVND